MQLSSIHKCPGICDCPKLWNDETIKLWNMKSLNDETMKLWNFEIIELWSDEIMAENGRKWLEMTWFDYGDYDEMAGNSWNR